MQIPANTTGSTNVIPHGETKEANANLLSPVSPKAEQTTLRSITEPLQTLLTTSATPSTTTSSLPPPFSKITTAARDAWSSAADALFNLLYPQPSTIITAPAQDTAISPQPGTTITVPPSNDSVAPAPGETVVVVPPGDQTPGNSGGTPSGATNDQITPIGTTSPGIDDTSDLGASSLIPSYAKEFEKTGQIEWRPRLNDGNLTMYFRPEHARRAEKVEIFSPDGKTLLATGKRVGLTQDGRPIYNFNKPGSSFPDGAVVVMTFINNGGARMMKVPETSERYVHGEAPNSGSGTGGTNNNQPPQSLIPTGAKEFEKTGEIEWRPRLNDGKLSMIFRRTHKDKAEQVQIFSADGKTLLATGKLQRVLADGRPVYIFDKPGSSFPDGAIVTMTLNSGGVRKLSIPETSKEFKY